jgi:hypothetical protein
MADQAHEIIAAKGTLIPQEVFLGDTAQLQVDFAFPLDLLQGGEALAIPGDLPAFRALDGLCTVRGGELVRHQGGFRLMLTVVPWKTGGLDFPPLDMAALVGLPPGEGALLDILPLGVASLVEKLGISELQPPPSPAIIPGTTYLIFGLTLLVVALGALLAIAAVKARRIAAILRPLFGSFLYSSPARRALRSLRSLCRHEGATLAAGGTASAASGAALTTGGAAFAASLEHILRVYLGEHFGAPFPALSAAEVTGAFRRLTGDTLDAPQEDAVSGVAAFLLRCDFLRYSGAGLLTRDEGAALAKTLRGFIAAFERPAPGVTRDYGGGKRA